jgi:pimeloyl-ACP methyl ester carboxylesterase
MSINTYLFASLSKIFLFFAFLTVSPAAFASYGDIITVYDYGDGAGPIDERTPITDDSNPFNADEPAPFTYTFSLAGQVVTSGATIEVVEQEPITVSLSITKDNPDQFGGVSIFRQEGSDYRSITQFSEEEAAGRTISTSTLPAGEYVAVLTREVPPILMGQNETPLWKHMLQATVLPLTAHAYYPDSLEVIAIPFTISYLPPPPAGASSVLFLPGIQASRLYIDRVFGAPDRLWEPNADTDVADLAMTETGRSVNDIYTKDVIDEVSVLPLLQSNIYKSFLSMLDDMKDDGEINNYVAFAYDWRYSVQDVVTGGTRYEEGIRSLINTVEDLAKSSLSGKVTIIAHSNGGLVAKRLITDLEWWEESDLIDKVIFIGTPHLGTPKAIATMLHGYDQQKLGGAIIDDVTAREVMHNMPGAYGLLPSEAYLEKSTEPIIRFSDGPTTQSLLSSYGSEIMGDQEYKDFLNGAEGREVDSDNISLPYSTNASLLDEALSLHRDTLDTWQAPEGIEVYNLVGVGRSTIKSIEYRDVAERVTCQGNLFGGVFCDEPVHLLRPYAHFTQYGDETVAALSAESVEGETYYFDFFAYSEDNLSINRFDHADFTEVNVVQELIENLIYGTSSPVEYLSDVSPTFTTEYEITSIDSPVRILKQDNLGNKTGTELVNGQEVLRQEIPNSQYFEFAGTKYIIIPKGFDTTTTLTGEDYGSYTLRVATLDSDDEQILESEWVDATTTPNMVATYTFTNGVYSAVAIDLNGDGDIDHTTTLDGEVIEEESVTYTTLNEQVNALSLEKKKKQALIILVKVAERASEREHTKLAKLLEKKTLEQLYKLIKLYEKKGWIVESKSEEVRGIIELLMNQIK